MLDAKAPDHPVIIPTEPIGSIPRPQRLIEAFSVTDSADPMLDPLYEEAIRDTIAQFEATGSPVVTDGEQRKYHNFGTNCIDGRRKFAIASWKRRATVRSNNSARRTIAAPFSDDTSTSRETAFAKMRARRWLRKQLEMNDAA